MTPHWRSLTKLWPRSLRAQLLGAFLVLAVVPLTAGGLAVYRQGEAMLKRHIFEELDAVTFLKSRQLAEWLTARRSDVARPASNPFFQREVATLARQPGSPAAQATGRRLREILDRLRSAGEFAEMFLLEPTEGRVVLSTDPDQEGKFKTDRPYFREGLRGPYVQHVYYSLTLAKAVMAFSAPLPDPDGQPAAILVGRVDLHYLDRLMAERAGLGETGRTFLVNRFNYFVSASLGRGEHGWWPVFSEGVTRGLAGETGTARYLDHEGRLVVGAYRWLPDLGLALIAELPEDEAFAPIKMLQLALVGAVGLVSAVAIGVGLALAWGITRPLTRLVETTRAIGDGQLTQRVGISGPREVAALATAVNRMADELLESQRDLAAYSRTLEREVEVRTAESETRRRLAEALAEVGVQLVGTLDPLLAAREVVATVVELFHVDHATVWRLDTKTGTLRCIAVAGARQAEEWLGRELPPATGLSALALETREPVWSSDLWADPRLTVPDWLRERWRADGDRAALALPLVARDEPFGTLVLGAAPSREFTSHELHFLSAFAAQAATALHNARLFQDLRQAYDELAQTQDQLLQAQKMEAVGRLAGGVAHDFNNLLTVILGRCQLLLSRLSPDDRNHSDIDLVQKTATRAADLTRQLLAFSRKQVLEPQVLELNKLAGDLVPMLRRLLGEDIELVLVPGARTGFVRADPAQLHQVIVNLAINARDAMPDGGRLIIETAHVVHDADFVRHHRGASAGPHVRLTVRDTGIGMDAATQAKIFEPFFTTKAPGKGTGLGLSTVYGIVKQHDGYISVDSAPREGTAFWVDLPQVDEPADIATVAGPHPPPRGSETIFLVEDEEELMDLTREVLEHYGYTVLGARLPEEALRLAGECQGDIALLVTDVVMPQMSGRELAARLAQRRPTMKILYMSGYTEDTISHHGVLDPGLALLQKPFTPDVLARKVREVLEPPQRP